MPYLRLDIIKNQGRPPEQNPVSAPGLLFHVQGIGVWPPFELHLYRK